MSEGSFHVHGPHEHQLEHAAQHGDADRFAGRIAVTTAILATVGALMAYQGGATQANAGLYKNDAAIKKTEASDQWNYYQAKSNKQNLAELAVQLATAAEKQEFYKQEVARYEKEKEEIKVVADRLEAEAKEWDRRSEVEQHLHHRWAQATTVLQIAIALSAIALLTRRNWLVWGVYGVAGLGAVLGAMAFAHV
jgi:hypothetical protein